MTRRGWVLFGALSVIWGVPYLLIKIAVTDVDPVFVAFGRTLIAALLLLPIALYRRALMPVFRRWKWLLVYTVVEISGPWFLLGHAETTLNSSTAGLLLAVVPMIAAIILTVDRARPVRPSPHPRPGHRVRRGRLPGRAWTSSSTTCWRWAPSCWSRSATRSGRSSSTAGWPTCRRWAWSPRR